MARTLYPAQVAQNYSEAKWSVADDNAQNETKPVAGDTIICTASSGKVTCDEPWAALALSATGACEWDFGAQTASVTNIIRLDNITATSAAATITATSIDLGAAGTLTMSDDLTINGGFLLDGGTIDFDSNKITITGAATWSSSAAVTTGVGGGFSYSGSCSCNWAAMGNDLYHNVEAGATLVPTGAVFAKEFIADPASSIVPGALRTLTLFNPPANDFISIPEGVVTGSALNVELRPGATKSNSGDVYTNGNVLVFPPSGTGTLNFSGDLSCAAFSNGPHGVGVQTVNMTG